MLLWTMARERKENEELERNLSYKERIKTPITVGRVGYEDTEPTPG